jgi:hypothetical protein
MLRQINALFDALENLIAQIQYAQSAYLETVKQFKSMWNNPSLYIRQWLSDSGRVSLIIKERLGESQDKKRSFLSISYQQTNRELELMIPSTEHRSISIINGELQYKDQGENREESVNADLLQSVCGAAQTLTSISGLGAQGDDSSALEVLKSSLPLLQTSRRHWGNSRRR